MNNLPKAMDAVEVELELGPRLVQLLSLHL